MEKCSGYSQESACVYFCSCSWAHTAINYPNLKRGPLTALRLSFSSTKETYEHNASHVKSAKTSSLFA